MPPVRCEKCKVELNEPKGLLSKDKIPCPMCGSTSRLYSQECAGEITPLSKLKIKGKREGRGRPFIEIVLGADRSRKLNRFMKKLRIIDREKNWYEERITDPETCRVIHECKEPLDQHTGHGSDKKT